MVTLEQQLFTEVFPVDTSQLPDLTAYRLRVIDIEPVKLGGKLAYRLRQMFPGSWVWAGDRVLTDTPPDLASLEAAVAKITREQPTAYGKLLGIEVDDAWEASPDWLADFVLRGPLNELEDVMRDALAKTNFTLRNARVEREHRARTWVVNGQPAISFSIVSRLMYETDLATYAATLEKPADAIGLLVADKYSSMQGQVVKIVGKMSEHRDRLLKLTQRETTREILRAAPDTELVVRVSSGTNDYDYAASALEVIVGMSDISRFGLDAQHAIRALRMKPSLRAQMVKIVADIAKTRNLISNAFSTATAPEPFYVMPLEAAIVFGGNRTRAYDVDLMPQDFCDYGAYWWRERFKTEPVRVALLNTLEDSVDDFMEAMQRVVDSTFGFQIEVVRERKVRVLSHANVESAVRTLQKEKMDLILAFVDNHNDEDDDDGVGDSFIKAQTIGRGLPCLVIHQSTFQRPEAMTNLIIGILARAGNVPYLFDEPLPYTDYVVGLDLMRHYRKEGDTLTGVTRIYRNDGALMCYLVASSPIAKGEGIPANLLAALLPADLLAGQRVVIHKDGRLRRDELRALRDWEAAIDARFFPVEIVRHAVPRLYALEGGRINRPPFGTVFRLGDDEAFLVTSKSPDDATPQPLHIHAEQGLAIEDALNSVMMFTLLHYGALKTPKLPVTIQHAEYIRSSVMRNVMPDTLEGDVPFWL